MRTKNSIKNTIGSISNNLVNILIGFIAQGVFIKILGLQYLGINGLFNNIVSMLSIVELGIASAIIFNLYKPLATNDKEKIKSLMKFYKKTYHIIALVILILGLSLIPFLSFFIKNISIKDNINLIYLLFIIDAFCSYLLSYKRSILYADQKNYLLNIIHIFYLVVLNSLQITFLVLTKNYILFLIIKIIIRIIENIVITIFANRKYNYLKDKNVKEIDEEIKKDIFTKVKALFFHKIGSFVILGTDNIIISKFLGIVQVGLYSNYYLIINSVQVLFSQIISSSTASVGNLLVTSDKEKTFKVFRRIRLLNFFLSTFGGVSILLIMNSFIMIWIGDKYLLSTTVLITLVINYYQNSIRSSFYIFKEAAGIFHEDRFIPIIESIINIISSIILLQYFGLAGVFMGTIVSGLLIHLYTYPKFVYKRLFDKSYTLYIKELLSYLLLFLIIIFVSLNLSILLVTSSALINLLINVLISITIPTTIIFIVFRKTDEYNYFKDMLKKIFRKKVISNEE